MKRLIIENESEIDYDQIDNILESVGKPLSKEFFTDSMTGATWQGEEAWAKIKEADEVYAYTSLIDSMGVSGGLLFNNMMYKTIEERVEGKSVFLLSPYKSIWWSNLRKSLVDQAFRKNFLYCLSDDREEIIQVDIDKLIKEEL